MKYLDKKIAIIGHFGGKEDLNDGQTVKTRNLYNELNCMSKYPIQCIDTYEKRKHPIRLLFRTINVLFTTKDIIILLSENGMKFYFPLLYYMNKIWGTRVYHDVIGGNLAAYVKKYPKFKKYLSSFRINWVETKLLKNDLEEVGIFNGEIIPNFRRSFIKKIEEKDTICKVPYKFCTFSRVSKEKGIAEAIKAIETVNSESKRELCHLDIYGPIEDGYKEEFQKILKETSSSIQYCGEVPASQAVTTIAAYFGTLFPTYWKGEGNAGTVIESLSAGVPVIATDWRCNSEMIKSGITGIIYPGLEAQTLEDGIKWLLGRRDIFEIKRNCLKAAGYYQPDIHIKKIINFIESV